MRREDEEIIKLIEERTDDYTFSISVENEAPDDHIQKLIEDRLIAAERKAETANDRMIHYNDALSNAIGLRIVVNTGIDLVNKIFLFAIMSS